MPNYIQNRFAKPETFQRLQPELLLDWLRPFEPYLAGRGVMLPPLVDPRMPVNYEAIARVFLEPTADMPPKLVEGMHLVRELGTSRHMEAMLEAAEAANVELELGPDVTPEDLALKLWMTDPGLLEEMSHHQQIERVRAFQYFTTD